MTDPKMLTRADKSDDFMKGLALGMLLVVLAWGAYCVGRVDGAIDAKAAAGVTWKEVGK